MMKEYLITIKGSYVGRSRRAANINNLRKLIWNEFSDKVPVELSVMERIYGGAYRGFASVRLTKDGRFTWISAKNGDVRSIDPKTGEVMPYWYENRKS